MPVALLAWKWGEGDWMQKSFKAMMIQPKKLQNGQSASALLTVGVSSVWKGQPILRHVSVPFRVSHLWHQVMTLQDHSTGLLHSYSTLLCFQNSPLEVFHNLLRGSSKWAKLQQKYDCRPLIGQGNDVTVSESWKSRAERALALPVVVVSTLGYPISHNAIYYWNHFSKIDT